MAQQAAAVGTEYFAGLEARLAKAVTEKLGVEARLIRWDDHAKTGAKIPVFAVPAHALEAACAAGLAAEAA